MLYWILVFMAYVTFCHLNVITVDCTNKYAKMKSCKHFGHANA